MDTVRRLSTKRTLTYHLEPLSISKPEYMAVDIQVLAAPVQVPIITCDQALQ
jgi:hypothetical protein